MSLPIAPDAPARPGRVYRRNGGGLSLLEALVVRDDAGQAEVVLVGELLTISSSPSRTVRQEQLRPVEESES